MPELPDLEVFSGNLHKKLAGKKLIKISILNKRKIKIPERKFKVLENQKLKKVYREGKELRFQFTNNILGLHLMLKGNLYWIGVEEPKYPIIKLLFEKKVGIVMTDYQGMATPSLDPEEKISPDALSPDVNFKFLKEKLFKTKTVIKTFLMDQKNIRGIGNAYADEILWDAKISPEAICNKLPDNKIRLLPKAIKKVLNNGIKKVFKARPGTITGEFRDFLLIHNSKKQKSPKGAIIKQKMVGGRKTYYTNEQEMFK